MFILLCTALTFHKFFYTIDAKKKIHLMADVIYFSVSNTKCTASNKVNNHSHLYAHSLLPPFCSEFKPQSGLDSTPWSNAASTACRHS